MQIIVTTAEGEPLRVELAHPPLGAPDVADLADQVVATIRAWLHGDPPTPAPPAPPERPEPPETPATPDLVDVDLDVLRGAAYVLFDRGRSVAQVAAALNLGRAVVRDWNVKGRTR